MKRTVGFIKLGQTFAMTTFLTACVQILGKEERLTITQLPAPVLELAMSLTKDYQIVEVEKETYFNRVIYSVNYMKDGAEWVIEFDQTGSIISHELE